VAADVEELKAKHGALHSLSVGDAEVIVKAPRGEIWRRYRTQLLDEQKRIVATENLVRGCVVWPDKAGLDSMLDARPGLAEAFGRELVKMAGAGEDVEKKAL
jgi:hypothetical protein